MALTPLHWIGHLAYPEEKIYEECSTPRRHHRERLVPLHFAVRPLTLIRNFIS